MASLNSYPTSTLVVTPLDDGEQGGKTTAQVMDTQITEDEPPRWLPFWLRQATLGAFACAFLGVITAQIAMLVYSHRHQGLVSVQSDLEYVWKFGPTASMSSPLSRFVWHRWSMLSNC